MKPNKRYQLLLLTLIAAVMAAFSVGSKLVPTALAQTNTVTLQVVSARTESQAFDGVGVTQGDPITEYKYIINIDNTGTTTQRSPADGCSPAEGVDYPASCEWTSVAGIASSSPIYTQGDQDDFAAGMSLPDGRYLISVLADGYKLDGAHFTVPMEDPGLITVELQPHPLPAATIQAAVFEDISPTNGAPDVPVEHGLAGFTGHIFDYLGEVTTDVFGNPLGTEYDGNGDPIPGTGGRVVSKCYVVDNGVDIGTVPPIDAAGRCPTETLNNPGFADGLVVEGKLIIPNLGPNRYALSIIAPDGATWIQTTTLEGNHDWDAWVMEGATGLDTEFIVAGEPFPAIIFGFLQPTGNLPAGPTGSIRGVVDAAKVYVPPKGGTGLPGTIWGGTTGMKIDQPIENPWISLTDLTNGDTAVYVGQGDANGAFQINNVPDGNYTLTWWDEPQNYILDLVNVTVSNGEMVDLGILPLTGWWTKFDGYVFNDLNRNGVMDWTDLDGDNCPDPGEGELGIPNYALTMRKRENSLMDRGATAVATDACGYYIMENAYPMTQWLVMEAYNDLYYTTGVTYQADNQPTPTTILGAGVDVSVLPIIGLSGRLDWGVHFYDPTGATGGVDPRNGGIVGTVSYDTTRNELDPQFAAVEDWQPGVSGLTVDLYTPVFCGTNPGVPCDLTERYELASDGAYATGQLLNTYVTETWERPTGCVARDVDGNPLTATDQDVLPDYPDAECLEGPLMGVQFQSGFSNVDGNYGFGDGCYNGTLDATDPAEPICVGGEFTPLLGGRDYLVKVEIPNDAVGQPLYKVTREEDINIGNGDAWVPQLPPPVCAGALHTVDVADSGTDGYPEDTTFIPGVTIPASTPTVNTTFLDIDGSVFEGQPRPLCDMKLVPLSNGRSIVPTFNVFTDVPVPGRFWGLIVDDLNFSSNPQSLLYGEKAGVPYAPVGIYDYTNRLVTTVESDYNGLFDVLLPSTNRINCPTPSGVCANLYRFVGNDPGTPGQLNPNYKPEFRTIAAEFEAIPGLIVPADLAPTQVGVSVQLPGGQVNQVSCALASTTPQLFTVSQPYVNGSGSFTINGLGFGTGGTVILDGSIALPTTAWSDTQINVTVPTGTPFGPHQLTVTAANGQQTVNGLTFHVLGTLSQPLYFSTDNNNTPPGAGGGGDDADIYNWGGGNSYTRVINANGGGGSLGLPNGANVDGLHWVDNTHFYLSFSDNVTIPVPGPDLAVADEDVVYYNAGTWSLFFDGSTHGLGAGGGGGFDLDAISVVNGTLYFSTDNNNTPPGAGGGGDDADIYRWNGGSSYTRVVNANGGGGSLGLPTGANVDGLEWVSDTHFYVSFSGDNTGVPGLGSVPGGIDDEDVVEYNAGTWTMLFDGTANGLGTGGGGFDLDAISVTGGGSNTGINYAPDVYEVGPGRPYTTIQSAIDAAQASNGEDLVVVYPGQPDLVNPRANPRGAYYENLIINSPIKLQGVGPGGFQGNTYVAGSIIDGGAFAGDGVVATNWYNTLAGITWDGNQTIYDGAVISIFAHDGDFTNDYQASIDGFDLRGGDQQGFPGNINAIGGGPTGQPGNLITQGGAIFANGYARYLQITNNTIQNNGGAYGTVRIGTPDIPAPDTSNHNENVRIANNRIIANGGTNLAGGIGLFAGANNYEVTQNDLCGNFSAEYGGGLSVYGLSPNGSIHDNRIYFNASYDEGGGIMIAGELPADPSQLSPGTGPVAIYNNLIQANLANDDGGGVRFLMAGNFPMDVYNNMIVNNISTHEGGGIGINDAPNVRVYNNTIMKNLTTATAVTSNGFPAPAGLSTSQNSDLLQATLPGGASTFSNPVLFNNIFWDNRAGTRAGNTVIGLGLPNDLTPINYWDLGVADGTGQLAPTNSVLQVTTGTTPSATNSLLAPAVVTPYDTSVAFNVWRNNPNFVGAILVAVDQPVSLLGNYHLQTGSPAINLGAASKGSVNAPASDYDGDARPANGAFEAGADETPGATTPPPPTGAAFPATGLLANFNSGSTLGSSWSGATALNQFRINRNNVQSRGSGGDIWWNPTSFGANQEAYMTLVAIGTSTNTTQRWQGLLLKFNGTTPNSTNASGIEVLYRSTTGVTVRTKEAGAGWVDQTTFPITIHAGDVLGARAQSNGTVSVYLNSVLVGTVDASAWSMNASGGYIGATYNFSGGRFDNFSGGTMP